MNQQLAVAERFDAGEPAWRKHGLRVLFVFGLGWAILFSASWEIFEWTTGAPFETLRGWRAMALAALAAGVLTTGVCLVWPKFLHIHPAIGPARVAVRSLVAVLVSAIVVALVPAAIEYVNLRQTGDPQHSQYGLSVVFAAIWYPFMLMPALAPLAAWLACRNETGQ